MSDRPDWNEWILQKNAEHEAEELSKSDFAESYETLEKVGMKSGMFTIAHTHELAGQTDHGAAKKRAHEIVDASSANPKNKFDAKKMINSSRNVKHLTVGAGNFLLAHPSEGLGMGKLSGKKTA